MKTQPIGDDRMKYAIVTGASKGLGQSIAELFLELGTDVIGISRTSNSLLEEKAKQHQVNYLHFPCNLSSIEEVEHLLDKIVEELQESEVSTLYIVNNAAMINPIDQASKLNNRILVEHVQINTVAPMIITNTILREFDNKETDIIGVNITSGAAERPIYGWSAYCSTKASINMYTKTVALEQMERKTGNKIIAFNPGIMDTNMQEKIRSSSEDAFIEVEKFKGYKEEQQLRSPNEVAQILIDILTDEINLENGKIYSIKEYI